MLIQEPTVTGLRASEIQRIFRADNAQAWALGQTTIMAETTGKGLDIVWTSSGRSQEVPNQTGHPMRPFLVEREQRRMELAASPKKELTHVEVRVRRWSPDPLYAWRTNGPWTARRISPEAEGTEDSIQPLIATTLQPDATLVQSYDDAKAHQTGEAQVGRLSLTTLGWTYHRLALQVGKSSEQRYVSVPVMVVSRTDNDDRH